MSCYLKSSEFELSHCFAMSSKYSMQLTRLKHKESQISKHTASHTKTTAKRKTNRNLFWMMALIKYSPSEYKQRKHHKQCTNCNVRINSTI